MKSPFSDFVFFQIQRGDFVFLAVLFLCIFVFVAIESVWLIRQVNKKSLKQSGLVWSIIPALVLLFLTRIYSSPSPHSQTPEEQRFELKQK